MFYWEQSTAAQKSDAIKTLHALIHEGLFGSRSWLAGPDILCALSDRLEPLGLEEPVPGVPNTSRNTPLGKELNFDLLQVFMGLWNPFEVPFILRQYGLMSDNEEFEAEQRLNEAHEQEKEKT